MRLLLTSLYILSAVRSSSLLLHCLRCQFFFCVLLHDTNLPPTHTYTPTFKGYQHFPFIIGTQVWSSALQAALMSQGRKQWEVRVPAGSCKAFLPQLAEKVNVLKKARPLSSALYISCICLCFAFPV